MTTSKKSLAFVDGMDNINKKNKQFTETENGHEAYTWDNDEINIKSVKNKFVQLYFQCVLYNKHIPNGNIELQNRLNESAKQIIVKQISEDLVDTQKDKLASLAEGVDFTTEADFSKKLTTIKESYFPKEGTPKVVVDETPVEAEELTPAMAQYLNAMNRWNQ